MALPERRQPRDQPMSGEGRGRCDDYGGMCTVCSNPRDRASHEVETFTKGWQEPLPSLGHDDLTYATLEEAQTQYPFQQLDLMADGRGRHGELLGGLLEAHVTGRGFKGP
jgi:hypothetical protein